MNVGAREYSGYSNSTQLDSTTSFRYLSFALYCIALYYLATHSTRSSRLRIRNFLIGISCIVASSSLVRYGCESERAGKEASREAKKERDIKCHRIEFVARMTPGGEKAVCGCGCG
ncbi:hypothetical protein DL95DRAFT_50332 [Leptodontidium sp. 2 PMI_412]|nr:hypothetical protein DL95DRAFT_50332 [Leptodontidium sp. 2 PMI_412]